MKASAANLQSILEGKKQFLVPLFQRTYSWEKKDWETLWGDLEEVQEEHHRTHFIGSMVTIPQSSSASDVAKYLLIDGQQRLTTILIILALLRNRAAEVGQDGLAAEITDDYLTNPHREGLDFWKLLPTQADREAFIKLMQAHDHAAQGAVSQAAQYFQKKLAQQEKATLRNLLRTIINKLMLVDIRLDLDEDPYLIFESLNAKGRPLTQADLIRNYFFMRIPDEQQQQQVYATYWKPMQDQLDGALPESIRHFLMRGGESIRQGDTYQALKQRVEKKQPQETIAYLQELSRFAGYYTKLLNPDQEAHSKLRERLRRLNRLEVTVAYPFLLNIYDDYANQRITAEAFAEVLDLLENFILRRTVCNIQRSPLNKIFPLLYAQASQSPSFIEGMRENLATKNYPNDAIFRASFTSSQLYGGGARIDRTKLILERLEMASGNKEIVPFEKLTIEHIMPQTLTAWWKDHLGEQYEQAHETHLNSIGNLTLTAYNSELSNGDFAYKRGIYAQSNVGLNSWFQNVNQWDEDMMRLRAEALADQALTIWPYFGKTQGSEAKLGTKATGKTPVSLALLDKTISVNTWRDVLQQTLQTISDQDEDSFLLVVEKYPHFVSLDSERFRAPRQLSNGFFIEANMSAINIERLCRQAIEVAGMSSEDWHVETS